MEGRLGVMKITLDSYSKIVVYYSIMETVKCHR